MHKAFINNKPLIFENIYADIPPAYSNLLILSEASYTLKDVIKRIETENIPGIIYLSASPDIAWNDFANHYTIVEAAGGIVRNEKGEVLTIFRKKLWDLPKGKLDYDESPQDAAIREVKEECGLDKVELNSFFVRTFHIYTEKNKNILKKTHWYTMTADSKERLLPQAEEKIEKVEWMNEVRIRKIFFSNTYVSISEVLDNYFKR
jgi:8-oxo-dGTP pyrophosphatase MutT (NUDIX family)